MEQVHKMRRVIKGINRELEVCLEIKEFAINIIYIYICICLAPDPGTCKGWKLAHHRPFQDLHGQSQVAGAAWLVVSHV